MTISSIGSGGYYTGQMSAMWGRTGSAGNRPDPSEMFDKVDKDGSGGLDQTEFLTLANKISEVKGEEVDTEELFATYDEDGDGVLSEEETQAAMEANRPEGPPPQPPGMTAGAEGFRSTSSAGIENYLKMAALGNGQSRASNMFTMFGGNDNAHSHAPLSYVNTIG